MASLSTDSKGNRLIQFKLGRQRSTVRLGKVSRAKAIKVKGHIEDLVSAKRMQQAVEQRTAAWVASLEDDDDLHAKLAAVDLVAPREPRQTMTLGEFLDAYVASRVDVKPATRINWGQSIANLKAHFGEARDIATIHEGDADAFKLYLIGEGLSAMTVFKRLQNCRMFFRSAMRRKLIESNPFADVSAKATVQLDRQYFVTRAETDRVLAECNPTWKVIVALARYGGLRCPSEVLSVRWVDVNWDAGRLLVTSPKTAHHPGKGNRVIPLFPELRAILSEAYAVAADGSEYVVDGWRDKALAPTGWKACNLRTQFERIIKRAGLTPWPRLFHALRSSRETELAKEWPLHVVTAWLGNTPKIAMRHYLMTTDADFERAAKSAAAPNGTGSQGTETASTAKAGEAEFSDECVTLRRDASSASGDDRSRTCTPFGTGT